MGGNRSIAYHFFLGKIGAGRGFFSSRERTLAHVGRHLKGMGGGLLGGEDNALHRGARGENLLNTIFIPNYKNFLLNFFH